MELCYEGALVMPKNFIAVNSDEMEYVEGGGIPNWIVATAVDVAVIAIPALFAISKFMQAGSIAKAAAKAASTMSRAALRQQFVNLSVKIAGATGLACLAAVGGAMFDILMTLTGLSLGGLVAEAIDRADGKNNGWCF